MNTGRRSFIKGLAALVSSLTLEGKIRAEETRKASQYVKKFKENSLPKKQTLYAESGVFVCSGVVNPQWSNVSGYFGGPIVSG